MTNIEIRVRSAYCRLSKAEKRVADYLLENTDQIFHMSISKLAEESGVSQVAWVRFCKTIGYDGLKALKRNLFAQLNEGLGETIASAGEIFSDIKGHEDAQQIMDVVKKSSIQAIEGTMSLLTPAEIEDVANLVLSAKSIRLFGIGASAIVAEDLYGKLIRINKNVVFSSDAHFQLTYASNIGPDDIAIFISHSGLTKEILECLRLAKLHKCPTVAITRYCDSPLASEAAHTIYTSSPEVYRRSGAMSSRIAQLAVIDVLFTAIASADYENIEKSLEDSYYICKEHRVDV